ncbi:MAG: DUF4349 domain-containing protein [Bacteroidales bacterium]|nr:DUF4349 domain-containing protein [Bacteroidales bacterium]MBN2750146.1 DUF4349 domain-containing protein [Bacteroidales bacterium]
MRKRIALLTLIGLATFSCTGRYEDKGIPVTKQEEMTLSEVADYSPEIRTVASPDASTELAHARKIIKNVRLGIETASFAETRKKLDSIVAAYGGNLMRDNEYNDNYRISCDVEIKVDAQKLEPLTAALVNLGKRLEYKNIEATDVTEEFIDLEARLKNKRKVETTLLNLLKKATTVEDVIRVEEKLGQIRAEIDAHTGRLKYLNSMVEQSTLYVNLYQNVEYKFEPTETPKFIERFLTALDKGWKGFVAAILFIIRLWPLFIITTLSWLTFKWIKAYRIHRKEERKAERKAEKKREKKNKKDKPEETSTY